MTDQPRPINGLKKLRRGVASAYWHLMERLTPRRYYKRMADAAWAAYEGDIAATKNLDERRKVEGMQEFEWSEYNDILQNLESHDWMKRGTRVHLSVDDIPLPTGSKGHWEKGRHGETFLCGTSLRKLKKLVEDAEYERDKRKREGREMWVKYFTAVAAALAASASLANLYFTYRPK